MIRLSELSLFILLLKILMESQKKGSRTKTLKVSFCFFHFFLYDLKDSFLFTPFHLLLTQRIWRAMIESNAIICLSFTYTSLYLCLINHSYFDEL